MKTPIIESTRNYQQFNVLTYNRPILTANLENIKKSVELNNLLPINPIIVDKDMNVIDGQHRLEAARQLGIDIYYIVSDNIAPEDMISLNAAMRQWLLSDYANFYAGMGNPHYKSLITFCEKYEISFSLGILLLGNSAYTQHEMKSMREEFKKGEFEAHNIEQVDALYKDILRLQPFVSHGLTRSTFFVRILLRIGSEYGVNELINRIINRGFIIPREYNMVGYMRHLEDAWNHGRQNKVRLY